VRTLQDVDQLAWLTEKVTQVGRSDAAPRTMRVTWTGAVQAPVDGTYTFSTPAVKMNVHRFHVVPNANYCFSPFL
jgi:hypothetical protein